ncbi:hypothetical protein DOM21_09990 [Bacteriovorax stolpii]|uniref:Uncharacterized protein n=1 Tax=Bacteriovorax stolpii TaxID=960 RepID=A0A2K9NRV3_BACTC|nr:hypothetical protein [Bacteriovorax stolpii]AUN98243.1 hypothetical protein C0V70_09025 [Bacteriovorax stolpii]QDK41775.1 hypothetical protein DOM21_09990 [Bacteriovorax stolpii]TDP52165.1 hypothetical protein C8D79_2815 [Bacteriovorax stolpii]
MKKTAILTLLFTQSVFALETDQFHAASHVLKESSEHINKYIDDKFEKALTHANNKGKEVACRDLADDVMTGIVGKFSISKISQFAKNSPDIERFPGDEISQLEYINQSIYKDGGFPFYFGIISRTINVGGVYIGTDKLGHFALVGRNYYRRYLENLDKGMSPEVAKKDSVFTGFKQEIHILGYTLGGVLSFGDLEANYQGMTFAISMCDGENPYLIKENGQWKKNPKRVFDIKNYINPKMDESYKPAFWKPKLWEKIKPTIKEVYCELKKNPLYIERVKSYQSKITVNQNDDFIKEFFSSRPKFDRKLEDIDSLCE